MIGLDRLMERPGVVAAGQFSEKGEVKRAVGGLTADQMAEIARLCVANEEAAAETVDELNSVTDLNWKGLNGWVIWGGEYALAVSGDTGVFVDATRADFNQLITDLFGPPAAGMPTQAGA